MTGRTDETPSRPILPGRKTKPEPVLDYGVFSRSIAFVANPGSGYEGEKLSALKAHGWQLALNCFAPDTDRWRVPAARLGVPVFPWAQVRTLTDLTRLINAGSDWSAPPIINVEKESETTVRPSDIDVMLLGRDAALLTSPWAEPAAGWWPLTGYVCASEAYLNADPRFTPNMVYQHLGDLGFTRTIACYGVGSWSDAPRPVTPQLYRENDRYFGTRPRWLWVIDSVPPSEMDAWLA